MVLEYRRHGHRPYPDILPFPPNLFTVLHLGHIILRRWLGLPNMMYRTSTVVHVCSLRSNVDTCRLPDCPTRCMLYTVYCVAEADADDGADVPPAAPARVPQPLPPLQRGVLTLLLSCPQAPTEPSVARVRH
jgi:hypothetical protein